MKKMLFFGLILATCLSFYSCDRKPDYKDADESLSYIWKELYFGTRGFYVGDIGIEISAYTDEIYKKPTISMKYSGKSFVFEKENKTMWSFVDRGYNGSTCYRPLSDEEEEIIKVVYDNF